MAPPKTCNTDVCVDVHLDFFLRLKYVSAYLFLISSNDSEYFSFKVGSSLSVTGYALMIGSFFGKTGSFGRDQCSVWIGLVSTFFSSTKTGFFSTTTGFSSTIGGAFTITGCGCFLGT